MCQLGGRGVSWPSDVQPGCTSLKPVPVQLYTTGFYCEEPHWKSGCFSWNPEGFSHLIGVRWMKSAWDKTSLWLQCVCRLQTDCLPESTIHLSHTRGLLQNQSVLIKTWLLNTPALPWPQLMHVPAAPQLSRRFKCIKSCFLNKSLFKCFLV